MARISKFEKLLVCCDLSEHAEAVARTAASLAGRLKAEVLLMHVRPELNPSPFAVAWQMAGTFVTPSALETTRRTDTLAQLERIFAEAGVSCITLDESGDPAEHILNAADRYDVDLIVVGCQGEHEVICPGPVADQVARCADCPVMLVR